jgi:hypothetical protein
MKRESIQSNIVQHKCQWKKQQGNHLKMEWRHLDKDGKSFDRCSDTGETVRPAYANLVRELQPKGWEVALKETLLKDQEIPESNSIY